MNDLRFRVGIFPSFCFGLSVMCPDCARMSIVAFRDSIAQFRGVLPELYAYNSLTALLHCSPLS